MSTIYKRNGYLFISFIHPVTKKRIRRSANTQDEKKAKQLLAKLEHEAWEQKHLNRKPKKMWMEAAVRWIDEAQHKRSLKEDIRHLKWLDTHLRDYALCDITRDVIDLITKTRESEGVSNASVNRVLALIRSILRKACNDWEWIDRIPKITLKKEKGRERWLTKEEAGRLLNVLPRHLREMAEFTLCQGLRASNVLNLKWEQIDKERCCVYYKATEMKTGVPFAIPLSKKAFKIILRQPKVNEYVFTFKGSRIKGIQNKTLKKALERAEIENFRWHDLRHTFATWLAQAGVSLETIQALGGWRNRNTLLRYEHHSRSFDAMRSALEKVEFTNTEKES